MVATPVHAKTLSSAVGNATTRKPFFFAASRHLRHQMQSAAKQIFQQSDAADDVAANPHK